MGTITTGIGLISGIDTGRLIQSLIALESRPRTLLQNQVARLQAQQAALLDINAKLLGLQGASQAFRENSIFRSALATSSNELVLTASASNKAQPGSFQFIVRQLVSTSQKLSRGFATRDSTPLGLDSLSFELGRGNVSVDTDLADLNGGDGVDRGRITIQDRTGASATVDLTDVTTLGEVIDRINDTAGVDVAATVDGDHLVITDNSGGAGSLTISNASGDTTAGDLGIAGSVAGAVLTGTDINYLGLDTSLASLNDGNGVLIRNNVADFRITARDGSVFEVDLGRVAADIDDSTLLAELNNGDGVTLNDDSDDPDITFVDRDGTEHEVDLTGITTVGLRQRVANVTGGAITLDVIDGERLRVNDTTGGSGPLKVLGAGDNGTATAEDLGILEEIGVAADSFDGELIPNTITDAAAVTVQEVIDRINDALDTIGGDNAGRIVASLASDGVSLQIIDTTGGSFNLIVESTAANPYAARDLGIETVSGGVAASTIDGERLLAGLGSVLVSNLNGGAGIDVAPPGAPATLSEQTLLSELLNGAGLTTNNDPFTRDIEVTDRLGNSYDVEVDGLTTVGELIDAFNTATGGTVVLSIEGQSVRATDTTGGSSRLRIRSPGSSDVADDLGIDIFDFVDTVLGADLQPIHSGESAGITITNRTGAATTVDLTYAESLQDIVTAINNAGAGVTASLNRAGNGLSITDNTAGLGNLQVSGVSASSLGIEADVAGSRIEGSNLQLRYVSEASSLADLNYGRGVGTGSFRITDGLGNSEVVSIGSDAQTLYDVIQEINSRGLAINARVNDNGDGLLIEAGDFGEQTPFTKIKIEAVSGTTARDLNILGESDTVENAVIDGSYERSIDVATTDTLDQVVAKINAAGIPVSASVLNTGAGAQPFRLSLTSGISGRLGELIIDTGQVDLGLATLARGEDAVVFFGSDDPEDAFLLRSSTNTLDGVIEGVTIDLLATSETPVEVTITRDREAMVAAVQAFVDAFNSVVGAVNQYDFFDTDTEERGILLGNATTARIRQALYRTAQQRAEGIGTSLQYLSEAGIRVGDGGLLTFDENEFREALDADPDALENLFATFEATAVTSEEIAPGITVERTSQNVSARGFGDLFKDLTDGLTNSVNGTITLASKSFESRIELLNERIEDFDQRLETKRSRLEAQFAAMEVALARLQGQGNALAALSANTALAQSLSQF